MITFYLHKYVYSDDGAISSVVVDPIKIDGPLIQGGSGSLIELSTGTSFYKIRVTSLTTHIFTETTERGERITHMDQSVHGTIINHAALV